MLDIDTAIKHCLDIADGQDKCAEISVSEHAKERISQCAAEHRQLAEWLKELKEAKRLLKAAVEDFARIDEVKLLPENTIRPMLEYTNIIDVIRHKWRYADEAEKLIES